MRVLIAVSRFPRRLEDGGSRSALDFALALSHHADVTVLAPRQRGAPAQEQWGAVEVRRGSCTPPALRHLASERACEIVHAQGLVPRGIASAAARGRKRRFASVVTVTGHDASVLPRIPAARAIARWTCARSDAVLAEATNVRDGLDRVLGAPSRARIAPAGVDVAHYRTPRSPRAERPFPDGFILFAGRLDERKGLGVLLRALPQVRARYPGLGLVALGDGPLAGPLRDLARGLGVAEWVRFAGRVDRARVAAYLQACRVACAPSIVDRRGQSEAMPAVLLEALAAGARLVATDAGGVPDLIAPGENGWLALAGDPHDLAAQLLAALDAPLPPGAADTADAHDWSRVAEQYIALYRTLL